MTTPVTGPRTAGAERAPGWRPAIARLAPPVGAFFGIGAVLTVIRYLASPDRSSGAAVWERIDGGAYVRIAQSAYTYSPRDRFPLVAFFPGYPVLIRGLDQLTHDTVLAAVLVSFASGLAATVLFSLWLDATGVSDRGRAQSLALLLLFAWGWFLYGTIYGDGLFTALAIAAFLAAHHERWWLSALLVGASSAVRPPGLALALGVLVVLLQHDRVVETVRRATRPRRFPAIRLRLTNLRLRHLAFAVVSLSGLIAYSAYLARHWGNPFLWISVQSKWSQGPTAGPDTWLELNVAANIIKEHDPAYIAKSVSQAIAALAVVLTLPAVWRRFGLGAAVYQAGLVALAVGPANEFIGAGRYLLAAFPFLALCGEHLAERPVLGRVVTVASATALIVQTVLFAQGSYLT